MADGYHYALDAGLTNGLRVLCAGRANWTGCTGQYGERYTVLRDKHGNVLSELRPSDWDIDMLNGIESGLAALCRPARLVTPREFGEMLTAMSEREYKSVSGRSESMFNGPEYLANVGSVLLPEKTTREWLAEQARSIPGEPQNLYGDVSAPKVERIVELRKWHLGTESERLELRLVERLDRHMLLLRNLGPNFAMREGDFRECGL